MLNKKNDPQHGMGFFKYKKSVVLISFVIGTSIQS